MMGASKPRISTETRLRRIAKRSSEDPNSQFEWLMPLFDRKGLIDCFHELDGRKALGTDGISKEEYGKNLESNIEELITRMKSMSYRPNPVREVLIPKGDGGCRPLGISNTEDKIVQAMTRKILDAIYDPVFLDSSYGFRKGRSCHQAVRQIHQHLFRKPKQHVIDLDLENFFGTISHEHLIGMLGLRIKDQVFLRYVTRMLKAGVTTLTGVHSSKEGTPQGSVASPCLANVFAHYVLDLWFEQVVTKHVKGEVKLIRYADDAIICCDRPDDAKRILAALPKRLERFGLRLNAKKTKVVKLDKKACRAGVKQGSFDFLGFTFFLAKSRKGTIVPKEKTAGKRFRRGLKEVGQWAKRNRSRMELVDLYRVFLNKVRGHAHYFGISNNTGYVSKFVNTARRIFFKWINRRSQKRSMNWEKFTKFCGLFPEIEIRVFHPLF